MKKLLKKIYLADMPLVSGVIVAILAFGLQILVEAIGLPVPDGWLDWSGDGVLTLSELIALIGVMLIAWSDKIGLGAVLRKLKARMAD